MSRTRLKALLQAAFSFSLRERKRVLLLLPLLAALCLLFAWQGKPRFERSFTRYSDRVLDSVRDNRPYSGADPYRTHGTTPESRSEAYFDRSGRDGSGDNGNSSDRRAGTGQHSDTRRFRQDSLFVFDPNTVTHEELVLLGFSPKQAQVILRYREAGAVFHKPQDFARCYTVSPEKYQELSPYIQISGEFRERSLRPKTDLPESNAKPIPENNRKNEPDRNNRPNAVTGTHDTPANTSPNASAHTATDAYPPARRNSRSIELNSADSAALVSIHGIGALTASRILRYREALGGFVRAAQLQEIAGMTDQNYQLILQQIWVDSSKIQKIDINFASPKRMQGHPYLPPKVLNRVLKYRQLKGGWSSTGDLIEQHILSAQQAERLASYLYFRAL